MNKRIGLIIFVTFILLMVTQSIYVEWLELFIIIGCLAFISIKINSRQQTKRIIIRNCIILGILLFFVFGIFDLTLDHFIYSLSAAKEDGRPLSLGMILSEFSDDLMIESLISLISILTITFTALRVFKNIGL